MNTMKIFGIVAVAFGAMTAFANKAPSGKISATLFDGKGNKEVLAEATYTPREPAPQPQQVEQPRTDKVVASEKDGTGKTVRTVEQTGNSTVVKDGDGRVIQSATKNADGSVTVRDGTGKVRETRSN